MKESPVEEVQNVLVGLFTIALMLGISYEVGSWMWGIVS